MRGKLLVSITQNLLIGVTLICKSKISNRQSKMLYSHAEPKRFSFCYLCETLTFKF